MKTKQCLTKNCKVRVKQQEWKKEIERNYCMFCFNFGALMHNTALSIVNQFGRKDIEWKFEWRIKK